MGEHQDDFTFVDPDGVAHAMTLANRVVVGRTRNRYVPPVRREALVVPGLPGTVRGEVSDGPMQWAQEVTFYGGSAAALRDAIREWAGITDPNRGPGVMRVDTPMGDTRLLTVEYDGGLELDEVASIGRRGAQQTVLTWWCDDPYWYADEPEVFTFTPAAGGTSFFPIPNPVTGSFITLSSSEVYASEVVTNPGQVIAYPIWTITGPGSDPRLVNELTGEVIDLSANGGVDLLAGQSITIDTRPLHEAVTFNPSTNIIGRMTDDSALWGLGTGDTTVTVVMAGAVVGVSAVELSFTPRFRTP